MAFTLGVGAGTTGSGTTSTIAPGTVTAGSLLVVGVLCHGTPTLTSDSINGTGSWVALTAYNNIPGSSKYIRMFYLLKAAAGSTSLVFGFGASGNYWTWAQEFKTGGVGATYDTAVAAELPATATTFSVTGGAPSASGELIVYINGINNDASETYVVGT